MSSFSTASTTDTNSSYGNDSDYEYYYDYDESVSHIPLEEIVPVAIVYGLTLLLGIAGNTLVIVSIIKIQRMRNVTNTFLMSLSSSDLIVVLICVPIKVGGTDLCVYKGRKY